MHAVAPVQVVQLAEQATHAPAFSTKPAAHAVHAVAPVQVVQLAEQATHAPASSTKPAAHAVHAVAPVQVVQLAEQAVQVAVPKKPSLQAVQVGAEEHVLQFCVSQAPHAPEPSKKPSLQAVQVGAEEHSLQFAVSQATHAAAFSRKPAAHTVHVAALVQVAHPLLHMEALALDAMRERTIIESPCISYYYK